MSAALVAIAFMASPALPAQAATQAADLATTMTTSGIAVFGGYMGYTVTVTNNGPDPASNVTMTDHTPSYMWSRYPTTFYCVGSVPSPGTGQGWCGPLPSNVSCTAPTAGLPGTVTCTTASLAPGGSMTVIMAIRVGFYIPNQAIVDTATAASSTFDPNPANNAASGGSRVH